MTFKEKVIVITGAASGIGRATAVGLAEKGVAGLALCDLDELNLKGTQALCNSFGTHTIIDRIDVSKVDQVEAWIQKAASTFGRIHGAANIAGIAGVKPQLTEDIDQRAWEKMIAVNLNGVMHCMRAQLAHMKSPGDSIVNVSSTSGLRGLGGNAAYASSKFAVIGLTESAAAEYGKSGIRINALLPGPIDTKIFRDGEANGLFDSKMLSAGTLVGRMGQADEVAKVLMFLLSDDASFVTGAHWTVDGGYSALGAYMAAG